MAVSFIHKNLADKRKEIQAYIGSLEREMEITSAITKETGSSFQCVL